MRAIIICFVALNIYLSNGMTIRSPQQQALFSESLVTKLKTSNLGRAIFLLAQVSGKQEKVNFNKLFDSLDSLRDSFQSRIQLEEQEFSSDQTSSDTDRKYYQYQIDQYQTESAQHAVDIRALSKERANSESTLSNKKDELAETKRQTNLVQNNGITGERNFKQQNDDLNSAISIIDKALELLEKAKDSSFVETNQVQYQDVAQEMHNTLPNLKNNRLMYQPLAEIFVQIGSQGFADAQNLNKAVKLLQNFRDSLNSSRMSLSSSYENEKKQTQELLDAYLEKQSQLANVIIPGLLSDIETKIGQGLTKQSLLDGAKGNLNDAQLNLDATNDFESKREVTHTQLIQEYSKELAILEESVETLQAGGIQRN